MQETPWLSALWFSQLGQVGDVDAGSEEADAGSQAEAGEQPVESGQEEPEFTRPIEGLPDALKGEWEKHRRGMQRSYTKSLEKLRARETELEERGSRYGEVDRFYNDPSFAQQLVNEWASKNGYQLVGQNAVNEPQVPQHVLKAVEASLPKELQWMAPHIAKAQMAALAPFAQQQQQATQSQREAEINAHFDQLSETDPGWEEHEDDMLELFEYLQSANLTHKRFGSKAKLLLNIVKGNADAIKEATSRMRNAVKHKGTTPAASSGEPNVTDRVRKANTDADAWALLKKRALQGSSEA